jgi:hypothetical protein
MESVVSAKQKSPISVMAMSDITIQKADINRLSQTISPNRAITGWRILGTTTLTISDLLFCCTLCNQQYKKNLFPIKILPTVRVAIMTMWQQQKSLC